MDDTDSLRKAAPNWSLAGDKQLLDVLQKIHQTMMTKCQEANAKLDAMVDALDNASIDLQNVNNKFMALSNSQFVESRVYDDDVDIKSEDNSEKQTPEQLPQESEIEKIKRCLNRLELMHEPVHILDSDSSDENEESSLILKPKDMYSNRPLPYIIGSDAWKKNWHAGLIQSDSDSDSTASRRNSLPAEEYSESEPEAVESSDSVSLSEASEMPEAHASAPTHSAAQVAAQVASRLAAQVPPPPVIDNPPPEPTTSKVYRMEKPAPATIFSNEPPPLPEVESESSDDDIFAELHKKSHRNSYSTANKNIVNELFADNFRADIGNIVNEPSNDREKSPLFSEARTDLHADKETNKQTEVEKNIKKPVGGISVFGTNKGVESIGAAILKRQQQSSDSDTEETPVKQNKNIIDELFTKRNKTTVKKDFNNKIITSEGKSDSRVLEKKDKVDLFSDIFDDIDDIFTTNVVKKTKNDQKSIFNDDDDLFSDVIKEKLTDTKSIFNDDLFSDEVTSKVVKSSSKVTDVKKEKSIFDSDDDLFAENDNVTSKVVENKPIKNDILNVNKQEGKIKSKDIKALFDDYNDVSFQVNENNISSKVIENSKITDLAINERENKEKNTVEVRDTKNIFNDDDNIIKESDDRYTSKAIKNKEKSIFDDNSDDDIFSDVKTKESKLFENTNESYIKEKSININKVNATAVNNDNIFTEDNNQNYNDKLLSDINKSKLQSPNLFDDDEINDLFTQNEIKTLEHSIIDDSSSKSLQSFENNSNNEQTNTHINNAKNNINVESLDNITKESSKIESLRETVNDIKPNEEIFNDIQKDSNPVIESKDIFTDIFNDLPPDFEKIESKRSKNVNALFDDDSDDELFFKKNDVISDEKPDLSTNSDRFRIFHDEPPDVDFSQKPLKNEKPIEPEINIKVPQVIENNNFKQNRDLVNKEQINRVGITTLLEDKDKINISKLLEENNTNNISTSNDISENIEEEKDNKVVDEKNVEEKSVDSNILEEKSIDKKIIEEKSVGKLKQMNFNINVNTLLPGASPKKIQNNIQNDSSEESEITTINKGNNNIESNFEKTTKITIDETDSSILDNKLSKERVKIQVKRRPSTRRARLEAVRQSYINNPDSSFDKPKDDIDNIIKVNKCEEIRDSKLINKNTEVFSKKTIIDSEPTVSKEIKSIKESHKNNLIDNIKNNSKQIDENIENSVTKRIETEKEYLFGKASQKSQKEDSKIDSVKKVVYILNDEDIFTDSKQIAEKNEITVDKSFKEKSLFDDSSDDELFGKKTQESLFEGEFSKSKKVSKIGDNVMKKGEKVTSLFGDESDDDDLFASKPKVMDIKQQSKANPSTNKPTEPVFEDPLSLLGDNDS